MPFYEFKCNGCDNEFEIFSHKFIEKKKIGESQVLGYDEIYEHFIYELDNNVVKCPKCLKSYVKQKITNTNFELKGTGWYKTDYANK